MRLFSSRCGAPWFLVLSCLDCDDDAGRNDVGNVVVDVDDTDVAAAGGDDVPVLHSLVYFIISSADQPGN